MFLNIHSLMSILIILAFSFDVLGSKKAINALHKTNHVISYNDILQQNSAWSRMVSEDRLHFPYFRKDATTHSTTDNNDERKEALAGSGTTHDTNKTIFQVLSTEQKQNLPMIGKQERPLLLKDEPSIWSTEPLLYNIGKRNDPDLFLKFQMQFDTDQAELALIRNIAWSLCSALNDDNLPLLGSWTFFNQLVSNMKYGAVVKEYLPVNPHSPDCPICKEYLDFLLEVIDESEIPFTYIHSDEMVYSKLCEMLRKNKDILLMGGFSELRVMQRLQYTRHFPKGYREWCVDAKRIAEGSIDQAFEERHYYRIMRFDTFVQFHI